MREHLRNAHREVTGSHEFIPVRKEVFSSGMWHDKSEALEREWKDQSIAKGMVSSAECKWFSSRLAGIYDVT